MPTCYVCAADSCYVLQFGDVGPDPDPRVLGVSYLCAACHPYLPTEPPGDEYDYYEYVCGRRKPDDGACDVGVCYPWAPCHNHTGEPVAPAPDREDEDEPAVEVEDDVDTGADLAPEAGVAADEPTAEPSRPASWAHVDD